MLTLEIADALVDDALREGMRLGLKPLAVAVVDAGGHVIVAKRQDRCSYMRVDIARAKAWGALGLGFGTRAIAKAANTTHAPMMSAVNVLSGGLVIPSPGGVIIADAEGNFLGAIGISGDLGEKDEVAALAAVVNAGFVGIPGYPGDPT